MTFGAPALAFDGWRLRGVIAWDATPMAPNQMISRHTRGAGMNKVIGWILVCSFLCPACSAQTNNAGPQGTGGVSSSNGGEAAQGGVRQ